MLESSMFLASETYCFLRNGALKFCETLISVSEDNASAHS